METVEQGSAVHRESASSGSGDEDPRATLLCAATRLREVADEIDRSARTMRRTVHGSRDPKAVQVIVDAATHVRLTADALDFVRGSCRPEA